MSWPNVRLAARLLAVALLAAPAAGCFQPMYAARSDGQPGLRDKLAAIEVAPITAPNASRLARIGLDIRNALMFKLYGNATGAPPLHRLTVTLTTTRSSLIVDPATALPTIENVGINANYLLKDIATDKIILAGSTFSRVSYDVPGQTQRFARQRAFRDAEDRASQEIAENINTRLASFFYAGM